MLKLSELALSDDLESHLASRQAEIDALAYDPQVAMADSLWDKKNAKVFVGIREALDKICSGFRRCHYCEDSAADEIEHIYPKKFYPERTFLSENYLFACGPCNGSHKRDQFAVFLPTGQIIHLERKKGDAVVKPSAGNPVFLDPRVDDPFLYMEFDPQTGLFVPLGDPAGPAFQRSQYTISILGLNKRDFLSRARRHAHATYVNLIKLYISRKIAGASDAELLIRASEIAESNHGSVLAEIGRQAALGHDHPTFWQDAQELWS